jgi:hypothetical protein
MRVPGLECTKNYDMFLVNKNNRGASPEDSKARAELERSMREHQIIPGYTIH